MLIIGDIPHLFEHFCYSVVRSSDFIAVNVDITHILVRGVVFVTPDVIVKSFIFIESICVVDGIHHIVNISKVSRIMSTFKITYHCRY